MASSIALPAQFSRRASGDESSSLLPLWIILGVGVALAIGWFALSSCLGDHAREALADRIRGLFSRNRSGGSASFGGGMGASGGSRSAYGRMRDDEAEAFDINAAEHDLYDDLDAPHQPYDHHSAYPPTSSGNLGKSKYNDIEDDGYDRRP